jgi:hypothetical protein
MTNKITWVMVNEPYTKDNTLYVDCEAFMIVDAKYYSTKNIVVLNATLEYTDPTGLDITDTIESVLSVTELADVRSALEAQLNA